MHKGLKQSAIFAIGVGTYAYVCHKKRSSYTVFAATVNQTVSPSHEPAEPQDRPTLPLENVPPHLKLQQVQVLFRHGARTPLHLIPRIPEANYEPHLIIRDHPASSFPYERLHSTGEPADWSTYEAKMRNTPLMSGVPIGTLTARGKEQMYLLGRRLQSSYREKLNMAAYNPEEVLVISSNVRRTVESAQGVLAGFFSKEALLNYTRKHSPIKIYVGDENYNILIPNTKTCDVLKKANHACINHSDFFPGFKADRLALEKDIDYVRDKKIEAVRVIQDRINHIRSSVGIDGGGSKNSAEKDLELQRLIKERSQAIERVDRLWSTAIARNPHLVNNITENDMKALVHLRRLEVEKLGGKFCPGYKLHFYFDPNPFFSNTYLCKEVHLGTSLTSVPSRSEPIIWKPFGSVFQGETADDKIKCNCRAREESEKSSSQGKQNKPHDGDKSEVSFFQWYTKPTCAECDHIWKVLKEEVWADPIKCFQGKSKIFDKWEKGVNFVWARDDLVARMVHGLSYPAEIEKHVSMIDERATTMLYYAMAGQHAERAVVSRLSAGPLLTGIVAQSEKIISGEPHSLKLCLYSSHDSTVTAFLELLGIWDNKWPPFAADVRLELYQDTASLDYFVRVLYCGKVQTICGQEKDLLTWADFLKVVGPRLIQEKEYRTLCASDVLERFAKGDYHVLLVSFADLLKHAEGEFIKPSEAPAGM